MDWQKPHFHFQVLGRKMYIKSKSKLAAPFFHILFRYLDLWREGRTPYKSRIINFWSGMKATNVVDPLHWGLEKRVEMLSQKTHQYYFKAEPILFIYSFCTIIKIPKQTAFSVPPCCSPSQVSPSKVPSCVLHSKPLKDLFDIERGGIISFPLKTRDAVI